MAKTKMNAQTRRHFGSGLRVETGFSLDKICILHPSQKGPGTKQRSLWNRAFKKKTPVKKKIKNE